MAVVLRGVWKFYIDNYHGARDQRLERNILMDPFTLILIVAGYVYFATKLGPRLMKFRKPFKLKKVLIVYNSLQVLLNTIIFYLASRFLIQYGMNLYCQPMDFSRSDKALFEAKLNVFYYFLKLFDLFDTVFFVLRKKEKNLTFLHIYHHFGIACLGSYTMNYAPGGHSFMLGYINSFIHIVMYFYYLLASLSNDSKSLFWFKKLVTQLQLGQFAFLVFHYVRPLLFGNCSYPKFYLGFAAIQNLIMLVLFSDFYYKAYIRKKSAIRKVRKSSNADRNYSNSKSRFVGKATLNA